MKVCGEAATAWAADDVASGQTEIKDARAMPTLVRLLLSTSSRAATPPETPPETQVFDVTQHKQAGPPTTLAAVRDALRTVSEPCVPAPALSAMLSWLDSAARAAAPPAGGVELGEVELGELGLVIREASALERPGRLLQEGRATVCVDNKRLRTPLRALRAQAGADGHTLTLVALVHTVQIPADSPLSRAPLVHCMHFIGGADAELVDLRDLGLGKRSSAVITHGFHASYYLRRTQQRQEHTAALRNLGLRVAGTQKTHTLLLDAYASHAQHKDRQLQCVSVFV